LARSYATSQGRFQAPDPLEGVVGDPQSWNRYAYVENDPINLSDPSGQGFWDDLASALEDLFSVLSGGTLDSGQSYTDTPCPDNSCKGTIVDARVVVGIGAAVCAAGVCYIGSGSGSGNGPGSGSGSNAPESTGNNPDGGGAPPGSGGPGDQGTGSPSGGQGPGGNGTASPGSGSPSPGGGGTWDEESPVAGSRLPNGDVAVGIDLFRNSSRCSNCGTIFHSAYGWGQATTVALAAVSGGVLGAELVGGAGMMDVAVTDVGASPFHVAYGIDGTWLHATGDFFQMEVTQARAAAYARAAITQGLRFRIPVLFPQAVLATEGNTAWWCVGAALSAARRGWLGF